MSAVDQAKRAFDDHCPLCGEGIDWEYGDHWIMFEGNAFCAVDHEWFGVEALRRSWQ